MTASLNKKSVKHNPQSLPVLMMARELNFGGIERDVSKLARHLPKFGISPHVACFRPGGIRWQEIEAAGIPVLPLPLTSFVSAAAFSSALKMRTYLALHDIQVVHGFDDGTNIFGVSLARIFGTAAALSSQLGYRDLSPMRQRMLLWMVDQIATGFYVNCGALSSHLNVRWKVPLSRINVCHNGFEPTEFHPKHRSRPPHLKDASVVIGTVALLRPEKNIPDLVEAFATLHKSEHKAHLLIVGSGPTKPLIEQRIAARGIGQACTLVEASSAPAGWMRAIDVFVLPSRSEAFSNSLMEAMACGCCPVATNVGGASEMICNGESGLLFEAGHLEQLIDALRMLALDPDRRQRMAKAALSFVHRNFTIDKAALRLANIYRRLAGVSEVLP